MIQVKIVPLYITLNNEPYITLESKVNKALKELREEGFKIINYIVVGDTTQFPEVHILYEKVSEND